MAVLLSGHAAIYVIGSVLLILIVIGVATAVLKAEVSSAEHNVDLALSRYRQACVNEIISWGDGNHPVAPNALYEEFKDFFDGCFSSSLRRLGNHDLAVFDTIKYSKPLFDAYCLMFPTEYQNELAEDMKIIAAAKIRETAFDAEVGAALSRGISRQ